MGKVWSKWTSVNACNCQSTHSHSFSILLTFYVSITYDCRNLEALALPTNCRHFLLNLSKKLSIVMVLALKGNNEQKRRLFDWADLFGKSVLNRGGVDVKGTSFVASDSMHFNCSFFSYTYIQVPYSEKDA